MRGGSAARRTLSGTRRVPIPVSMNLRSFASGDLTLFEASPLPTVLLDGQHLRILAANTSARERYGYSHDALLTFTLEDLLDPAQEASTAVHRDPASGAIVRLERQQHRRKDGTTFPVYCAFRGFFHEGMRYLLLVATELSELRVLDAEDRFVEKMEGMRRLGGGIAHEFNNLLTAILATADLALENQDLADALREDFQDIRDAGQRAAAKTRQLMAFSGSQVLTSRVTDVNDLLEQLSPLIRHILPAGIELRTELRATCGIRVDPARLEQATLNLVLNAVDAMPAGGALTIATRDIESLVEIRIADAGSGMDELTLSRMFEPFSSTRGPSGGRGLGLASVWGTVRQMNGSIEIESAVNKGTTVRMFFPAKEGAAETRPSPAPPMASYGGEVILVVDDEASVRAPISRKLRMAGYFVLEADNGAHALDVMANHPTPVHLVITDVMMPEMDGARLVDELRSWYPRTRALLISGYSPQYLAAQGASRVDGSEFLAKPFGLDDLLARVRSILDTEWS